MKEKINQGGTSQGGQESGWMLEMKLIGVWYGILWSGYLL
jgi:hypothetical protein